MNKRALLKLFEAQISADLAVLTQSAKEAHEAAIHAESKAEDQYDTRGLEASYLAGAQSKRAAELESLLVLYQNIDLKSFDSDSAIAATALVELDLDGKKSFYLLMPLGGGMVADFEGKRIHVVTPQSPMGEAILGRRVGDQVEVEIQKHRRDYDITQVW